MVTAQFFSPCHSGTGIALSLAAWKLTSRCILSLIVANDPDPVRI
jgi:hypothetical protein